MPRLHSLLFAILLALATPHAAQAQIDAKAGETAALSGPKSDLAFASGGEVRVDAQSSDDIFAAGGKIGVRTARADGLFVAGGQLDFDNFEARDVSAAGGQLKFKSGRVTDDLIAAGGQVTLAPELNIGGSAVIAGGDVEMRAPVGGDLELAGGDVELESAVTGSVRVTGERVVIGPNSRIGGKLIHRARSISISPQAQIAGGTTALPYRTGDQMANPVAAVTLGLIAGIVMLVLLGWAAALVFPDLMAVTRKMILDRPVTTLGAGLLVVVIAPVLAVLLIMSVVGLPLVLVVVGLMLAALPLAIAAVINVLGAWLRDRFSARKDAAPSLGARAGWSALAAVSLAVIGLIPVLGWLMWVLAYILGVGAVIVEGWRLLARGLQPARAAGAGAPAA